jgi:HAD superfamily hydrolase (TIGR01509 family)
MAIIALIFDVDGTLAETEELHRQAFNAAFRACGLTWNWDRALYRELLKTTGGKERMRAFMARHAPGDMLPEADVPALHADKTRRYGALVASGVLRLRPGIAALIGDARAAGLQLAVATTTNTPNVDALCRACFGREAGEVFDVIAAGDMVARKKPASDVFDLALARLGIGPRAAVGFEDSHNGLLSARAAGIRCVVSPGPYTRGQNFAGADLVLDCFSQLDSVARLEQALEHAPGQRSG